MEGTIMTPLQPPRLARIGKRPPKMTDEAARIVVQWQTAGVSIVETSERLGVHRSTVCKLRNRGRALIAAETGTAIEEPKKRVRGDRGKRRFLIHPTISDKGKRIGRPPKVTDEILAVIMSMQSAGYSIPATSERLGIGETTVKTARRRGRALAEA